MKVSVLIPIYKPNPAFLKEALDCLMHQTEQDFEAIICEEPTDTDSSAVLKPYLEDSRITHYKNETCIGIGGNWNRCLSKATAPVIAYLFQDDLWETDYLETAVRILADHKNVGFISMNHDYKHEQELWTKVGYDNLEHIKKEVLRNGPWTGQEFLTMWLNRGMHPNLIGEPPFVVLRKEVMEEVGPFNETMPQFLDVEYWLRCLLVTDWYYEAKCHGQFRVHGEAASFVNNEKGQGLYDRLTCYQMLIDRLSGDMRKLAVKSRKQAVEDMAKKFFMRVKRKQGVSKQGSGQVFGFVLRHPFMVSVAVMKVLWKRMFDAKQ